MTVYADVLIILNLFVNYFLLLGCKILLRREVKRARLLLGACVGAVYSLIIFAPAVGSVLSVLLKLLVSVLITLCAFGYGGLKSFLSACGSLFGMSFVFGGLMFALWIFVSPNGMVYKNGAVYFNISLLFVCFATVICYIAAIGLSKILRRGAPVNHIYKINLTLGERIIETQALMDTGNSLSDSFTDTPVMLLELSLAKEILPPEWIPFFDGSSKTKELPPNGIGFRVIPFRSVGGSGLLPAFQPDSLEIRSASGPVRPQRVFAAVVETRLSSGDYHALLNPRLLNREERGRK